MSRILLVVLAFFALSSVSAQRLTTALSSNPQTLDPQLTFEGFSFSVTNQVYETLVRIDGSGEIIPGLAAEWAYPAPNQLQLTLREGVTFHDGTPLDAEAVKASLERLLDPETGAPGRFVVSAITSVTAPDAQTVVIETAEPFAPLLAHLAHPVAAIVKADAAEALARAPIGTGPYRFVSWQDNVEVVLEANASYWGGAPDIAEVVYRIIPDVSTQIVELHSGGIDLVFNVPVDNYAELAETDGLTATSFLGWGSAHLGFNVANPKLQDVRVRQALNHAIDKGLLVEAFFQGLAEPAVSPIPPTVRFAAELEEAYPYDPERARALLSEAGADGLSLRLDVYQDTSLEAAAQILQAMFAEVGVTLELRVQEYPAYLEAAQQDSLELYMTSWGTVTLDADYTLYAFFHSSEIPQNNLSRFDNPEVDGWLDEGRATPEDAVREEVYTDVQQTVLEDMPMVTLYYPYSTYVKGNRLQGEEVPFSFINLDLRNATLSE